MSRSPHPHQPNSPSSRRSRSFAGCLTCRRRRMKCDETHPRCRICSSAGIACEGYAKTIYFDSPEKAGSARFRRPVQTEEQREEMSKAMTLSVSPDDAMRQITRIEEECDKIPETQAVCTYTGPFGAFRIPGEGHESMSTADSEEMTLPSPGMLGDGSPVGEDREPDQCMDAVHPQEDALGSLDTALAMDADFTSSAAHQVFDVPDAVVDSWWSTENVWTWESPQDEGCAERPASLNNPESFPITSPPSTLQQRSLEALLPTAEVLLNAKMLAAGSIPPTMTVTVPHDAVFLLKHYCTIVVPALTPYRHVKTPWHVLYIPLARSCLAAITMGDNLEHASLCTFYGMLSSSAYSLGALHGSRIWLQQAKGYKQQARMHAISMLMTAYSVPKKEKYKSTLMALLIMGQISNASRNRDQAEGWFLEAEKFIRIKGLNRRKSRKVRMLHHCYAFERLLHESTFSGSADSQHRHLVRHAIESSGAKAFSHDGLSFEAMDFENLEEQMLRVKDQDEGENDLHVQWPGVWAPTQYPEIFGIPEIHLFLLSAITRLGRWRKDAMGGSPTGSMGMFMNSAKAVERYVLKLADYPGGVVLAPGIDPEQQHCQLLLENLSSAMQQALIIFFYRKVYDVDSAILQSYVISVRDCLLRYEALSQGAQHGSTRLLWPAYIAAMEAKDIGVRWEFCLWFNKCSQQSGLRVFKDAKADIETIGKDCC